MPPSRQRCARSGCRRSEDGAEGARRVTDDRGAAGTERDGAQGLHRRPAGWGGASQRALLHAAGGAWLDGGDRGLLPGRGHARGRLDCARGARGVALPGAAFAKTRAGIENPAGILPPRSRRAAARMACSRAAPPISAAPRSCCAAMCRCIAPPERSPPDSNRSSTGQRSSPREPRPAQAPATPVNTRPGASALLSA